MTELNLQPIFCQITKYVLFLHAISSRITVLTTAPDLGGPKRPGPRAPHHVCAFSHICDMCVPIGHFSEKSLFVDAINYIGRPNSSISLEEYLILLRNNYTYWFPERRPGI